MKFSIPIAAIAATLAMAAEPKKAPAIPDGPGKDYDVAKKGIARGKIEEIAYESKSIGMKRPAAVYTPPGYDATKDDKYPVLYLLHGIGDIEVDWVKKGKADAILDNLLADKKIEPMIVVMPNGRAMKDITVKTPWKDQVPAFAAFEKDLLEDLIPHIEKNYRTKVDRKSRAIAGLSMGGGQTLNFGLAHTDVFAWIAAFAPAPTTKPMKDLLPKPEKAIEAIELLWVSCGDEDFILETSKTVHEQLDALKVPHAWHLGKGPHEWPVWQDDLFRVSQLLFKSKK